MSEKLSDSKLSIINLNLNLTTFQQYSRPFVQTNKVEDNCYSLNSFLWLKGIKGGMALGETLNDCWINTGSHHPAVKIQFLVF